MKVYLGQTRAKILTERLREMGFGEMTVREEYPPRRLPWVFDNGAFKDWRGGLAFQTERYEKALDRMVSDPATPRPDFIIAPDIVAGGLESLRFSCEWAERLSWLGTPLYVAVQDGMTEAIVLRELGMFSGVFVGGSPVWKMKTGEAWTEFAHSRGLPCHIGRMGTEKKVRAAIRWGVDSIDSALPLWAEANLRRFLAGFSSTQKELFA